MKRMRRRPKPTVRSQPLLEVMEDRQLMTAGLQPISNLSVPAQQGYTVPLLATSGITNPQTFTVTSSNPDIAVSIAPQEFWTVGVSYTDPSDSNDSFTGSLVFNLLSNGQQGNLTWQTVDQIQTLSNSSSPQNFTNTFKYFSRVAPDFPNATNFIVQGGSPTLNGTETPSYGTIPNENFQQFAFTGTGQLAMANSGGTDTGSTQFFVTDTGSPNSELGYNYTIFGQLVAGQTTLTQMTQVPVMFNSNLDETSQPVNPLTITSTSISKTNPNGTLIVDTTQAKSGETGTVTVTASDGSGHTSTQSFTVTVGAYGGPTDPTINFRPFATAVTESVAANTAETIQLVGSSGYPDTSKPSTLSYSLVSQPAHGTVSNFNATTGSFTYTPDKNYSGLDTFDYEVSATGPETTPSVTTSNPTAVTLTVAAVNTGAVRLVGTSPDQVLIVTPLPRFDHGTNTIDVQQVADSAANGGSVILVLVNGKLDEVEPGVDDLTAIDVFGGAKVKNNINIESDVTVPTIIDGGHGQKNTLTGGGGSTREHGWFGHSTLVGGAGPNYLIGRTGLVRFKPSKNTQLAFTGTPHRRTSHLSPKPPGGTFYKYVKGHLVVVQHNP